jgi:hypothetical protein
MSASPPGPESIPQQSPPLATAVYPIASASQVAAALPHKTARRLPWLLLSGSVLLAMLALGFVARAVMVVPAPPCGPGCTPPPPRAPALPLRASQIVSGANGFSLQYSSDLQDPQVHNGTAIGWIVHPKGGSDVELVFAGGPSGGQSAEAFVEGYQRSYLQQATVVYQVPGDELGYVPAYGVIYDVPATPGSGQAAEERVLVSAAVKAGTVVRLVAMTPLTAQSGGHANPSLLDPFIAQLADTVGNTVTWK